MASGERGTSGVGGEPTRLHGWVEHGRGAAFVAVTVPAGGRARGVVALVAPPGTEGEFSYRATVYLAGALARRGVATVRVDPPGVGDADDEAVRVDPGGCPGHTDLPDPTALPDPTVLPDPSELPSLVVDTVRRVVGPDLPVGYAGLRIGALVAAGAAALDPGARLLMQWDPVADARRHLRAAAALLAVATGLPSDLARPLAVPGAVVPRAAVASWGKLALVPEGADGANGSVPTLALLRPEDDPGAAATVRPRDVPGVEVVPLPNADATVAPPGFVSLIPSGPLEAAAEWIGSRMPPEALEVAPRLATERRGVTATGAAYTESVRTVGPDGLFAVVTRPAVGARGPWVVFHHAAAFPHHGPGRLWVTLSRELAADGVASVRWDRRGVGETGIPAPDEITPIYGDGRYEDVEAILAEIAAPDEDVTLVGLCSGGLAAAVTALAHPRMRVVYVAPQAWNPDMPAGTRADLRRLGWDLERAAPPRRPRRGLPRRLFDLARRHNPYPLWLLLSRTGLTQVPGRLLVPLARRGVRLTLLFPRMDWPLFVADHGPRGLRRARRHGWDCEIVHLAGDLDDHNLWSPAYLDEVAEEVRRVSSCGASAPGAPAARRRSARPTGAA